jgi:hypothetical protein
VEQAALPDTGELGAGQFCVKQKPCS